MDIQNLKLIFEEGDTDAKALEATLRELKFQFERINQSQLDQNDFYRSYTSPTLLSGSKIIYGASEGSTCGLAGAKLPSALELKALLLLYGTT